jgi:hypothetical protein
MTPHPITDRRNAVKSFLVLSISFVYIFATKAAKIAITD